MYNKNETINPTKIDQLQICLFALLDETLQNRELMNSKEIKEFKKLINHKK